MINSILYSILVLVIIITAPLNILSRPINDVQSSIDTAYSHYDIYFPANENGKTVYSLSIFDKQFLLSISMPNVLTIDEHGTAPDDAILGAFSNIPIIDERGNVVGYIGYNIYDIKQLQENVDAEGEMRPMMIYNQIGLAAHYRFTIIDNYDIVSDTDDLTTAVTNVYNDMNMSPTEKMAYNEDDYSWGIVSYCKTYPVYVAIQIDRDALPLVSIIKIAESIRIMPADTTR